MGTNGAFGGSGAKRWEDVRDAWESIDSSADGAADGPEADAGADAGDGSNPYDSIAEAIARALIGEDPDARRTTVPTIPLSAVLPRRSSGSGGGGGGGGGGGPAGGSSGGGGRNSMSGTRRVTSAAARGGSAIGAAAAYRDRDGNALAEFGLSLAELDALSPRMRCARILDMAIGQATHPDEQALRQASLEQIKALTADQTGPEISGIESIRTFIGELTLRFGLVELRDQILAKTLTPKQALQHEKGLRQWVRAKISRLDIGQYGQVSPTQFHQVARQMTSDALKLLGNKKP